MEENEGFMALTPDLFDKTCSYLAQKGLSEKTKDLYHIELLRLFGKDRLTQTLYNEYYGKGQRYRAVLKLIIDTARHYDLPTYKYKSIDKKIKTVHRPRIWSLEQIKRIVRQIEGHGLLIECAYYIGGGLRFSSAIMLKWTDFLWEEWLENQELAGKCDISAKGDSQDYLDVDPYLMNKLYNIALNNKKTFQRIPYRNFKGEHYMFFEDNELNDRIEIIKKQQFDKMLNEEENLLKTDAIAKAKNELIAHLHKKVDYKLKKLKSSFDGQKIRFHSIRHSRATHLLEMGFDITEIQKMLMHKDISTTQIYVDVNRNKITNKYNKLLGISDSSHSF